MARLSLLVLEYGTSLARMGDALGGHFRHVRCLEHPHSRGLPRKREGGYEVLRGFGLGALGPRSRRRSRSRKERQYRDHLPGLLYLWKAVMQALL